MSLATPDEFERRLGSGNFRRRLLLEQRHEETIARRRIRFFHRDNWFAHPAVIRTALRLAGLYERGRRNAEQIAVRRNLITRADVPDSFNRFSILHLSDLHADANEAVIERITALIDELRYDICVLTGDYRAGTYGPCDEALAGMRPMRGRINRPVYAVLGNHDPIEMISGLEDMGIRVLLNESEEITRGAHRIFLGGIDDAHFFRSGDIARAASAIPPDAFSILLSHTPEVFRQAAQVGFKVLFSGHTHGGQICLPGSIPITLDACLPRRFGAGAWQHREMNGYTSAGAGTSVLPVRFNCPAEITLHELRRS